MNRNKRLKEELKGCLDDLERGELTPQRLRAVIEQIPDKTSSPRQNLLYVQTEHNGVHADLIGYTLVI